MANFVIQTPNLAGWQQIGQTDTNQNHALATEVIASDQYLGAAEFIYVAAPTTNTSGQTVSSIALASGIATMTTGSAHGLVPGAQIIISGATPTVYNGNFTVLTVPSTTTFTFAINTTSTYISGASYVYGTIQPNMLVTLTPTLSGGKVVLTAALWTGTANTGIPLGVSTSSMLANTYGWIQVTGNAVINTAGTPAAGNSLYWNANGIPQPTTANGKQVLNAEYVCAVSQTVGGVALSSLQAVAYISRPFAQGAIL